MVVFQKLFISPEDVEKMLNRPEMKYVAPAIKKNWENRNYNRNTASKSDQIYEARRKLLNKLHANGANILLGTDSGNPFTVHGFSIHEAKQLY